MQKIWHLSPINQLSTFDAVVAETLARAQKIAEECGKRTVSLTYDLAVAKRQCKSSLQKNPNITMYLQVLVHSVLN